MKTAFSDTPSPGAGIPSMDARRLPLDRGLLEHSPQDSHEGEIGYLSTPTHFLKNHTGLREGPLGGTIPPVLPEAIAPPLISPAVRIVADD